MIYDDLNHYSATGRVMITSVREQRTSKQWILVVRIAINSAYEWNGVIKKSVTTMEGQQWFKTNPTGLANLLTKGTRVLLEGSLKNLDYTTKKDGRRHKTTIIRVNNISILSKSPNDEIEEEEIKKIDEQTGNEDNDDFELDIDSAYDNPFY